MIFIVACCHGAKLCAHAARDLRSQQNDAVTRIWRSCRVQPSHKERAIGVVRCKKEGMLLQSLRWFCVDCVIHHERDVREEQIYICAERASNSKRDCALYCCLLPLCEAALRTCRSGFPIATLPSLHRNFAQIKQQGATNKCTPEPALTCLMLQHLTGSDNIFVVKYSTLCNNTCFIHFLEP